MAPVYSTRFLHGTNLTPGGVYAGPVPAGTVWIVRSADFIRPTFTPQLTGFFLGLASDFSTIYGAFPPYVHGGENYHWEGRHVLDAGESLVFYTNDVQWRGMVSGYQLTLP